MQKPKNDLQHRIAARIAAETAAARLFTLQLSEDMMLKAAYTAFAFEPEALDQLRTAFRQEYHEWRLKLEEDNRDDKELWYSSEVHERELRQIMGEYYEDKDARYGLGGKERK